MFRKFFAVLRNPFRTWFIWCLLIINILGSLYGFYWYRYQLAETPWYYLIFVPDSPLSSSLFCLVLLSLLAKKRSGLLELFAYVWLIKYGLWAVLINLNAGYILGNFTFENWLLSLSHLGMAVEGVIFLGHLTLTWVNIILVALWMSINDFMDYAVGLHPYLFDSSQLILARSSALVLTLGLILLTCWLHYKKSYFSRFSQGDSRN